MPVETENAGTDVRLVSDRLVLREIEETDLKAIHGYWSTPEVGRFMPKGALSDEGAKSLVRKALSERYAQPRRYFRLAITMKDGAELIGDCQLRISDPNNSEDLSRIIGQAYIGFFFDKRFWGRGYATEVAKTLLVFGFQQVHLARVFAWCDTENTASIRVLEKAGMKREAHFRKSVLIQGEWRDCYVYGCLDDEWKRTD
jgi:RimJ/RimL family protein N-acetyltransferase